MLILLTENSGEWYLICITLFFPLWFAWPQRAGDAVELPPARAALPFQASAAKPARNVAVTYLELQLLPGSALGGVGVPAFSFLFYIFFSFENAGMEASRKASLGCASKGHITLSVLPDMTQRDRTKYLSCVLVSSVLPAPK